MKKITSLTLLLMMLAGCTQSAGGMPEMLPSGSNEPEFTDGPSIQTPSGIEKLIYHLGPVDLPANADISDQIDEPMVLSFQVDAAKWLVGFEPRVVDGNGDDLPSELLHQAIVVNKHEENPLCAGAGNPFIAANSLLTSVTFPSGYAYPLLPTDPLEAHVILKNTSDNAYANVYLELVLLVRPMDEMADFNDLRPVFIESNPCSHLPPDLPPSGLVENNIQVDAPISGNMIVALGMLQDYGAELSLSKGDETETVWSMSAQIDEEHRLVELTNNPFEDPAGTKISAGENLNLRYSYENTTDSWLKSASAAALLYIAQE